MTEAYIYDAVRTPRGKGKKSGSLHEITALELSSQTLRALRDRNDLDTKYVDDVVLGCVSPVGEQGGDIARIAVLNADYAETTAGVQVDRFCASGLEACNMAAAKVMTGEADMAIGGGIESMSRVPMGAGGGAWSSDPAIALKSYFSPQGVGADTIATKWGFSRDDVDAFAVESQRRAAQAWKEGRFAKSIVPVKDQMGGIQLDHDEHMRPEADMQSLAALNPSFAGMGAMGFDDILKMRYPELEAINHVHHAGNSSGIVDGASAVLFGSKEMGERLGLKPRARVKQMASIGSEPGIMLTGPTDVTIKALRKAGMEVGDIDLYELNEAFASVVLLMMHKLNIDHSKMNVNGGAIAFGHPLGATGIGQIFELVEQLRGRAGDRQVDGARMALAENGGGFHRGEEAVAVVTILGI